MIGHTVKAFGNKGVTMRTFTEENGYRWLAFVSGYTAKQLMKYGTGDLVIVSAPSKPKFTRYTGFHYNVYLRLR